LYSDAQRLPQPPLPPSSWRGHALKRSAPKTHSALRIACGACLMLTCLALLAGCVVTPIFSAVSATAGTASAYFDWKTSKSSEPIVVAPDIVDYTAAVQARAADELDRLGKPCPADTVIADCSAMARFIIDYGRMRDQVRAARATD
jgi:hypothetical protein